MQAANWCAWTFIYQNSTWSIKNTGSRRFAQVANWPTGHQATRVTWHQRQRGHARESFIMQHSPSRTRELWVPFCPLAQPAELISWRRPYWHCGNAPWTLEQHGSNLISAQFHVDLCRFLWGPLSCLPLSLSLSLRLFLALPKLQLNGPNPRILNATHNQQHLFLTTMRLAPSLFVGARTEGRGGGGGVIGERPLLAIKI